MLEFLDAMAKNEKETYFLNFLREHQPLPSDDEITEEQLVIYDGARKFFIENPNKQCVPLFLNSFGDGDGSGVYQLVEDTISQFALEDVLEHLIEAMSNEKGSVQYWAAQIAYYFPCEKLLPYLERMLYMENTSCDYIALSDIKTSSLISLDYIKLPESEDIIK